MSRFKPYRIEIFLLLALLPALYIAFGNPNTILDWYSSDDGFLYFQVAKNLAAGHGFTFDGIHPTNGFHPLWLFVITPLFWFARFDLLFPLRLLLIVSALLSAGSAILLYRILRKFTTEWVASVIGLLWIVLPRIHDLTMHAGVEAGLSAFTLLLFWHQLLAFSADPNPRETLRGLAVLGLVASLAIFSRLDNVFVVGLGAIWLWSRLWQGPGKSPQNPWLWRLQAGLALAGPIALLMAFYIAWNAISFGIFQPISGEVKLWWGTLKNTVYGFPVKDWKDFGGQFFTDDPELGPWSMLTAPIYASAEWLLTIAGQAATVSIRRAVLVAIGGILFFLGAALIWIQREFITRAARNLGLLPFLLGCLAQITYYKVSGSVAQQPWYWISEMIFLLLVGGLLLHAIGLLIAPLWPKDAYRFASIAGLGLLAVASLFYFFFIQMAVRASGDGSNHFYINRARWLKANTEEGARVAITGAGNLAYFVNGRTIVNMDGLMNTHDYLLAMQAGRGATYLAEMGVDYVLGNEYILTQTNPYAPMLEGHLIPYKVYAFADREFPLWQFIP